MQPDGRVQLIAGWAFTLIGIGVPMVVPSEWAGLIGGVCVGSGLIGVFWGGVVWYRSAPSGETVASMPGRWRRHLPILSMAALAVLTWTPFLLQWYAVPSQPPGGFQAMALCLAAVKPRSKAGSWSPIRIATRSH
jgi:hypothetical protein